MSSTDALHIRLITEPPAAVAVKPAGIEGAAVSMAGASATTIDTAAPSIPAGLTATAAGGSVINLMWSASVDDIGVTAYIVKRNGVQVATPTATTYADTGLSSAT